MAFACQVADWCPKGKSLPLEALFIGYSVVLATAQRLLCESNQTLGDFATNCTIQTGCGFSAEVNAKLGSDLVLHLIQSALCAGNEGLVAVVVSHCRHLLVGYEFILR